MKKVFLDTNILLDFVTEREGVEEASSILQLGEEGQVCLKTSFLTMANVAYVARKGRLQTDLYELMQGLAEMVEVLRMDERQFQEALSIISTDFEDVLQFVCAKTFECDVIVTRNKKDFKFSTIKILSPKEFLSSFWAMLNSSTCEDIQPIDPAWTPYVVCSSSIDAFNEMDDDYLLMNKLYLRLRNYDTEIDVALSHFPNKEVGAEIRKHDLDTLMFKPGLLVEKNVDALKNLTSAVEEIHKKERELKDKTNIIRDLEIKKGNLEVLIQKAGLSLFYKNETERYTEKLQDYLQSHKEIQDIIQQLLNYRKLSVELGNEIEQDESIKETIDLLNKYQKQNQRGLFFSFDGITPVFSIKL